MEINASHRNVEWCSMSLLNMKYVRQSREQILVDNLNIHNNVHLMCLKGTVYRHFSKTWGKWNWKVRHDSYMILFQICFCVLNRPTELNVCAINQKQHFTHHNIFHSKCHLIKYISVYFYLRVSFFNLISLPLHLSLNVCNFWSLLSSSVFCSMLSDTHLFIVHLRSVSIYCKWQWC